MEAFWMWVFFVVMVPPLRMLSKNATVPFSAFRTLQISTLYPHLDRTSFAHAPLKDFCKRFTLLNLRNPENISKL